jgi:hypothetical protein
MDKEISLQHVQLPNNMTKSKNLTPTDLWIYLCIKSFMNGKTKECFPSLRAVSERSGFSIPTIRKSITLLVQGGWVSLKKSGRKQYYYFSSYSNFEVFSYEFILKKDVSPKEKSYLVAMQQYMFKDTPGLGKSSYQTEEVSDKINLPAIKVERYERDLIDKGYLSLVATKKRDPASGIFLKEKFFHLNELEQAVIFALQKHEEKLEEHTVKLEDLEIKVDDTNKKLLQRIAELEKEVYKKEEDSDKFTM